MFSAAFIIVQYKKKRTVKEYDFHQKMCVLRQMRAGFSGDGKQVGGVVKAEQYGKNLAVEVSVVGFAPLAAGEYYCLIADSENRTELLPLRGKSLFNLISDLDISGGFCAVICLVKTASRLWHTA